MFFFFNSGDSLVNYFDFTPQKNQFVVETRVEYQNDYLEAMAGYVVFNENANNKNVVFL